MSTAVARSGGRRSFAALSAGAAFALLASPWTAEGAAIFDKSFFDGTNPTVIDFETTGAGASVDLIEGQSMPMPLDAYASLGVVFGTQVNWVNDGNGDFDAAQLIGGSPVVSIPSANIDYFEFNFTVPVRAFGFFVVNNRTEDAAGPTMTAYDGQGNVIHSVSFAADGFIQGSVGDADYGFMGILSHAFAPSSERGDSFDPSLIARVVITKEAAIFDDLIFSEIPAPGTLVGVLGFGAMALRRRR